MKVLIPKEDKWTEEKINGNLLTVVFALYERLRISQQKGIYYVPLSNSTISRFEKGLRIMLGIHKPLNIWFVGEILERLIQRGISLKSRGIINLGISISCTGINLTAPFVIADGPSTLAICIQKR